MAVLANSRKYGLIFAYSCSIGGLVLAATSHVSCVDGICRAAGGTYKGQGVLMFYRGPGFLAVAGFDSYPTPSPPLQSARFLSFSVFLCVAGSAY
jgi:hypothetical protein